MNGNLAMDYSKNFENDNQESKIYERTLIHDLTAKVIARLKEREHNIKTVNNKSLTEEVKNNFIDFLPKYTPLQRGINSFISLQKWEGYVTDFNNETIFAQLINLTNNSVGEFAEIPIEEISPEDKDLLSIGAVFYWNIGYHDSESGQRTRASIIRFRRLPKWTKKELDEVENEDNDVVKYFE